MSTTSFRHRAGPGWITAAVYVLLAALSLLITFDDPERTPRAVLTLTFSDAARSWHDALPELNAESAEKKHSLSHPDGHVKGARALSGAAPGRKHVAPDQPPSQNDVPVGDLVSNENSALNTSQGVAQGAMQQRVLQQRSGVRVSREEAIAALDSMLTRHPQFRESILREMIAGAAFIPDTVPHPRESLLYMLSRRYFPRGVVYGASGQWRSLGGYDPVHGWDNALQKTGPQINLLALPEILDDLFGRK